MSTQPNSLPMYFPPQFVQADAVTCATLVLAAYDQFNQWSSQGYPGQANFNWTPNEPGFHYSLPLWGTATVTVLGHVFNYPEPFGFVAWDGNGNAYVVFRGTMTHVDALIDAEVDQVPYTLAPGFGNVQVGWNNIYSTISAALLSQLAQIGTVNRLYFTGHSMGSALSSLAVPDVATNSVVPPDESRSYVHYNYASPRVGDQGFANGMNWTVQTPTYRVVNTEDVVPDAPLPLMGSTVYQHIGTSVDFSAEYLSTDGNHSMANCYAYAINNPTQPQGPVIVTMLQQVRIDGPVVRRVLTAETV